MYTMMKRAELEIVALFCCFSSILNINHFGELMKKNGRGSILNEINLYKTKYSRIIKNVLSKSSSEQFTKDIKGKSYSLVCDETMMHQQPGCCAY